MARNTETIQQGIITALKPDENGLSKSKTAEWRLISYVVAAAIHAFEVILDLFRSEVDSIAYVSMPGTVRWYIEMCKRFQYGSNHKLVFNPDTATYAYEREDPAARIVKVVTVSEGDRQLFIKVAKQDEQGMIIPLDPKRELPSFQDYIKTVAVAGTRTSVTSPNCDTIRYHMDVYYDPAVPFETIGTNVEAAIEQFKTNLSFNAMFYAQRLVDAVMGVTGVVTVDVRSLEQKTSANPEYTPVGIMSELHAGYFEYDPDSTFTLKSISGDERED